MTCIELCVIGQKFPITLKSEDLAILVFKKIQDTPTQTGWSRAQFQKGQNYVCFSLLISGL